jgi:FkbM family methyltransferase
MWASVIYLSSMKEFESALAEVRPFMKTKNFFCGGSDPIATHLIFKSVLLTKWPFAPNYERLKANIELNQCWRTVKAEQIAMSNETGMANFATKSTEIGSSGGQIGEIKGYLPQMAYPVEVTTGDAYANIWGCPNYVKIDVDGIEEKILSGMPKVLNSKSLKSVLIEDNTSKPLIKNILEWYGFEPWVELERLKLRQQAFNRIYRRK